MVRLTCLQPSGGVGNAADGGNAAKRARTDGADAEGGGAAASAGAQEEEQEQGKEEELTLAVRAQRAIEELGAAAGWEKGVKARYVLCVE